MVYLTVKSISHSFAVTCMPQGILVLRSSFRSIHCLIVPALWEPETIVTQRVIRPSYFYTFSTLCGKFMLLLAQALHAVCPGIVVISGICPSYKRLCHLESTLSIRFEIVWSVWLSVLGNP